MPRHPCKDTRTYADRIEQKRLYYKNHPESWRRYELKKKYGITLEDYAIMFRRQGGKCDICGREETGNLAVDHCHMTGQVRGLLCGSCNRKLGWFEFRRAAISEYLAKEPYAKTPVSAI
jgi:hypothetical protein